MLTILNLYVYEIMRKNTITTCENLAHPQYYKNLPTSINERNLHIVQEYKLMILTGSVNNLL